MGKRRGDPLLCPLPLKRLLREMPPPPPPPPSYAASPEEEAAAGAPGPKRKIEEGEEQPPLKCLCSQRSRRRREQADAAGRRQRRRRGGTAADEEKPAAEGPAFGRGKEQTGTAGQEEDFSHYNSFLYWRTPLPTLSLSDMQSLEEETPLEARAASRTDTMETEMET